MIIVTQQKTGIVNLNKVEAFYLTRTIDKFGKVKSIKINARGNYDYDLGEYATEERAKDILIKIVENAKNWEHLQAGQPEGCCSFIYIMPED